MMLQEITQQAKRAAEELLRAANVPAGGLMVVGCSTSEVGGEQIGTGSSMELAQAIVDGLYPVVREHGVFLAAQCCEHLNRAIILERAAAQARNLELVSVVPWPKAGGSFATTCWRTFDDPVAVEEVEADCGLDIGGTFIGMHLKRVAVPVRLPVGHIGSAILLAARTRPKYIGGERAHYLPMP